MGRQLQRKRGREGGRGEGEKERVRERGEGGRWEGRKEGGGGESVNKLYVCTGLCGGVEEGEEVRGQIGDLLAYSGGWWTMHFCLVLVHNR